MDWKEIVQSPPEGGPLREVILHSWTRSRGAGVVEEPGAVIVPRVPDADLRRRTDENALLLEVVTEHLEWAEATLAQIPHVIYFADADGIVLAARGTDERMMEEYGLEPGADWSETTMGTNGAGTCLATGQAVTVFGEEHFLAPLRSFVCTAAPVRDSDGRVRGAIDLSTATEDGRPQNLVLVAHLAFAVGREYALRRAAGEERSLRAPVVGV